MKEERVHNKCLLLNADYSPFGIIEWNKAIIWSLKIEESEDEYPIEIIDFYKNDCIQGTNRTFPVPAVARTKKFFYINDYTVNFNRKNILVRDNYTCQYCYKIFDQKELTYDHVIPKSIWKEKSSPTNWTNIVTCCVKCNRKKSNRTPSEANMKLKNVPIRPIKNKKFLPVIQSLSTISSTAPNEWKFYLPDSYEHI